MSQLTSRLWLRASVFCAIGVASALLGLIVRPYVPPELAQRVGADAVDGILEIIASSMLAVTTFSLSVMVSAYAAAASSATPRATKLLLADPTSQNCLSTFIGSFLFSIVGIVALKIGVYGESGRFILFLVTLAVILFVVLTLLHWVEYLSRLGRVGHTVDMVEEAAADAIRYYCADPFLGGVPDADFTPGPYHSGVTHPKIGYIQHVDVATLDAAAEKLGKPLYLARRAGAFNDGCRPLVYADAPVEDDLAAKIRAAFSVSGERTFEQDPRYGLLVLAEIALRALSPAVNDPGTAIDVIGTLVRLLAPMATLSGKLSAAEAQAEDEAGKKAAEKTFDYPHVHVPPLDMGDVFNDSFNAIARDGAGMAEVALRLQKAFASLAEMENGDFRRQARLHSGYALRHALAALPLEEDREAIKAVAIETPAAEPPPPENPA
ncbi:MAG: DUF2254 domain-containing protein [Alphaproteobacteria bacterium]|nr:DUF2254 domain-containing protein [Alphaproteobacteria bacterium]